MCPALRSEEQTASLPCAAQHTLRAVWTSCRVRGIDQGILKWCLVELSWARLATYPNSGPCFQSSLSGLRAGPHTKISG